MAFLSKTTLAMLLLVSTHAAATWTEQTFSDEMRNTRLFTTTTKSLNTARLAFPYTGGTSAEIALRKSSTGETSALILISRGQMLCDSYSCAIPAKFDNEDIEDIHAYRPDGAPSGLFVVHRGDLFIEKIKRAKKITLELYFFNHGPEQFKFDVRGLKGL